MTRVQAIIPALLLALTIGTSSAYAHARLDHASPAVGSTVASSPGEVVLYFTENLEGKFSSADVQSSSGARISRAAVRPEIQFTSASRVFHRDPTSFIGTPCPWTRTRPKAATAFTLGTSRLRRSVRVRGHLGIGTGCALRDDLGGRGGVLLRLGCRPRHRPTRWSSRG